MFPITCRLVSSSLSMTAKRRWTVSTTSPFVAASTRCFSFSFVGPKKLDDVLKKELVKDKNATEISDLWYTYHEGKENVHGIVLDGKVASPLLARAAASPFFIQPIFREDGFFMLLSQFMEPSHFIMAYLEDYKMDPVGAQPLLTFSVFDDLAKDKDVTLVRTDILNRGINDEEALKVVRSMVDHYVVDEEYSHVKAFNAKPKSFDFDDYIAQQNTKWKEDTMVGNKSAKTVDVES